LVLNSGSSSLKYRFFDKDKELMRGHVDRIGLKGCFIKLKIGEDEIKKNHFFKDHLDAVIYALSTIKGYNLISDFKEIKAVGHRVVHGGEYYKNSVIINDQVIKRIKQLCELAPLHNPANLAGILAVKKALPKIKQVAVFDTAFHQTIPDEAFLYGIPYEMYKKYKIRKYGFHGTSHQYVAREAAKLLKKKNYEMITCHLGNGSSITAIKDGKSVDTSMGFTPLDGLIMGTRSGEIDPEIILYLINKGKYTAKELDTILNKQSGLKGITGMSDVRDIRKAALRGNKQAKVALEMLAYRISLFIGGYMTILHGLDCIVFTAGIGEQAYYIRKMVCESLKFVGLKFDDKANRMNKQKISAPASKIKVFVIPTNEELEIANECYRLVK
jgi:acetate kinase